MLGISFMFIALKRFALRIRYAKAWVDVSREGF